MKTYKRNLFIFSGVALVVLLVGMVFLLGPGRDGDGSDGGGTGDSGEYVSGGDLDATDVGERLEYRFKAGKVYFSRNILIEGTAEGQSAPLVDQEHGGPLAIHAIDVSARSLDLILELDPAGELAENLPAGAKTFLVQIKIDRRGRVTGLKWRKDATREMKNPLRDIILTFFRTLPPPGSKPEGDDGFFGSIFGGGSSLLTYFVPGQDTFGAFVDSMEVRAGDGTLQLQGVKKEYTRAPVPVVIEESRYAVDWDVAGGYFKTSRGDEKLALSAQGLQLAATGKFNFDLQSVEDSPYTGSDLALFTIPGNIYDFETDADAGGLAFDESAIRPWADLQNMLTNLEAASAPEEKQALFHSLSESMKRDPGIADQALQIAANYTPDDDQFQMVMGSVAYSAAPIAQDLLVNFYKDQQLDENGQLSVINAMTMMQGPLTSDALDLVASEFQNGNTTELRDAAGLALGSALRNNPESNDIYQTILAEWQRARGTDRQAAVIEMIGNSGDPRYFPILKEALGTDNANFRMQVIAAMRHMYDKDVQALLMSELTTNENATMRIAAIEALSSHPWQSAFLDPMKTCVQTQPADRVRILCSDFALGERLAAPEMLDVLRSLSTSGISEDLKNYITQQLSES